MKIDTLVLSGGSTKVPAYVGVFRALQECNIINDKLDNIKHNSEKRFRKTNK